MRVVVAVTEQNKEISHTQNMSLKYNIFRNQVSTLQKTHRVSI
jgi:hypothetical protein